MNIQNWKTTVSGVGASLFALLTALAALPYQLGDVATIIPAAYKEHIFIGGAIATVILKVWNSIVQKDK